MSSFQSRLAGRCAGRGAQILYGDNHIVIDDMVMPLGSAIKELFPEEAVDRVPLPLLKDGTELNRAQLQMLLIGNKDEFLVVIVFLVLVMLVFGF